MVKKPLMAIEEPLPVELSSLALDPQATVLLTAPWLAARAISARLTATFPPWHHSNVIIFARNMDTSLNLNAWEFLPSR
jgi:hypothetical protein